MKTHEKLQLHAEEIKYKHLEREGKKKIQNVRKDLPEKRMIPFFFYESGTVHVMVDFLKDLGELKSFFFDNEISESFERRCAWAKNEKHQHQHAYIEAFYLIRGEAVQNIGKKTYSVAEGEFWIMNSSVSHCIVLKDKETLLMNLLISEECYQKVVTQVVDANNPLYHFLMNEIYEDEKRPEYLRYRIKENEMLEEDFNRLLGEADAQRPFMQQLMENILANIFLELSRIELYKSETLKRREKTLDIYQVMEYISQNYHQVTLNDLAEQFYYTPAYISRFLREQTGMNFRNMVCKLKLEKAREMLANTNWSIEKISESMNYSNRKHFEKSFQELFCQTPYQYRKNLDFSD